MSGNFCLNSDFHVNLGIFYMPQIYDMGPTLLPLRRKACWGFLHPKNPTASAGFEPANLGTKGQHATPRPPKPLRIHIHKTNLRLCTTREHNILHSTQPTAIVARTLYTKNVLFACCYGSYNPTKTIYIYIYILKTNLRLCTTREHKTLHPTQHFPQRNKN